MLDRTRCAVHAGGMKSPPLPPNATALSRWAGLFYLVIIACGLTAELAVRSALIVPGDAAATAARIVGREALFLRGVLLDMVMLLSDVALAVLLFLLFRPVGLGLALAATAFRLVQAAVLAAGLLHLYAAHLVLTRGGFAGMAPDAQAAIAMLHLDLHAHGYDLGLLFFAVTCAALGTLVQSSGWFPRPLGWLLWAAALVYLMGSGMRFLAPDLLPAFQPLYAICILAEAGFCAFLLWGPRGP